MLKKLVFLVVCVMGFCPLQAYREITPKVVVPKKTKKYNLSICAIFKNEAKYLKEWIEYHRLVGVDHFYLYSNNSSDRSINILKPYIDEKIVTLIRWPDRLDSKSEEFIWALSTQVSAYENAIKWAALNETSWLAIIDIDEFLLPVEGNNLIKILEKYKQYPGVILTREFFDASYVDDLPQKDLIIQSLDRIGAPHESVQRRVEKMIFKPEQCEAFFWPPYRCVFKRNQKAISLTKWEMRVNHYENRNKGYLNSSRFKEKLQIDHRVLPEQETEFEDREKAIHRFVPDVLKKMGFKP